VLEEINISNVLLSDSTNVHAKHTESLSLINVGDSLNEVNLHCRINRSNLFISHIVNNQAYRPAA